MLRNAKRVLSLVLIFSFVFAGTMQAAIAGLTSLATSLFNYNAKTAYYDTVYNWTGYTYYEYIY